MSQRSQPNSHCAAAATFLRTGDSINDHGRAHLQSPRRSGPISDRAARSQIERGREAGVGALRTSAVGVAAMRRCGLTYRGSTSLAASTMVRHLGSHCDSRAIDHRRAQRAQTFECRPYPQSVTPAKARSPSPPRARSAPRRRPAAPSSDSRPGVASHEHTSGGRPRPLRARVGASEGAARGRARRRRARHPAHHCQRARRAAPASLWRERRRARLGAARAAAAVDGAGRWLQGFRW
jgi:hypothetical protein